MTCCFPYEASIGIGSPATDAAGALRASSRSQLSRTTAHPGTSPRSLGAIGATGRALAPGQCRQAAQAVQRIPRPGPGRDDQAVDPGVGPAPDVVAGLDRAADRDLE